MSNITITNLFTYPLKSAKGIHINTTNITQSGFEFDRNFAIVNNKNKIITARENTKLLHISTSIIDRNICLKYQNEIFTIHIEDFETENTEIILFKKNTCGKLLSNNSINNWLSKILEEDCRLIKIDTNNQRKAKNTDTNIAFSDAYPVHLVNTASINDLNRKLNTPISDNRFRPNIIISNAEAYEEESWKSISIGNCIFDVIIHTQRCSLITVDSLSLEKNQQQEPLRTLALHKRGHQKVNFGMYLIPRNNGIITKNDKIIVTQ